MTGDTCILMCKVKTYAPNNQTGKKTEQGRWKKPKQNQNW